MTKDSGHNSLRADGAGTARSSRMQDLLELTLQIIDRLDICNANPVNNMLDKATYIKIVPLIKEVETMQITKLDGQLGEQCLSEAKKLNETKSKDDLDKIIANNAQEIDNLRLGFEENISNIMSTNITINENCHSLANFHNTN